MSNNITGSHVDLIDGLQVDMTNLFHLGEFELKVKGEASSFRVGPGCYLYGSSKGPKFNVTDVEIFDVGSSRSWEIFKKTVLPHSAGSLTMSVLFESGDIEDLEVSDGKVKVSAREWYER